jgi:N-ethylmaleimide reductase
MSIDLFAPFPLGDLRLRNRLVMAPMTRSRALGNVPNELMATYYAQRADAGLLITEGTAPSPNGLGYARIPGLFDAAQAAGWRQVTDAVHGRGGRIFVQLMHTGRASHPANLPAGAETLAPSAVALSGEIWTDGAGMQPYPTPRAMTVAEIEHAVEEFAAAARLAIEAGFDGVEIHGANGRDDRYGGSAEGRNRFALEVCRAVAAAIGARRTGIRLSPFGAFNDMGAFPGLEEQFGALATDLGALGLVYVHLVDHSSMGAPEVPGNVNESIRNAFGGTIVVSGGLDRARAEAALAAGRGHLAAFGRPFLANPDLVERLRRGAPLNDPDPTTFYTPGAKGYTDYPTLAG